MMRLSAILPNGMDMGGEEHNIALKSENGELCNGTTQNSVVPVQVNPY